MFLRRIFRIFLLCGILSLTGITTARPAAAEKTISPADTSKTSAVDVPPPALLKDIYTADASSAPANIFPYGNTFLYSGYTPATGFELWASDGTPDGTELVSNIFGKDRSGADQSSYPKQITSFRDQVFFTAQTLCRDCWYAGTYYLLSTDGSTAGTHFVYETGNRANDLVVLGDWLYFDLYDGALMRYGGPENTIEELTPPGFSMYSDYETPHRLVEMNGALYFAGTDGVTGQELWRYDPASGTLAQVKDICPATCLEFPYTEAGSFPFHLTVVGNTLYFVAVDAEHGHELWASDGSEAGTRLVKDVSPGKASSAITNLTAAGGWLYFSADDGTHGVELWRSAGAPDNTSLVADLAPGGLSSAPQFLTVLDAGSSLSLFFSAHDALPGDGHGVELWTVPVTAAGTPVTPTLLEIALGPESGRPEYLTVLGNTLYFAAQDTPGDIELWKSNGSPETTTRVADLAPGPDGSAPEELTAWNGKLVFSAVDALNGREPWISDGTALGTRLIGNMAYTIDPLGSDPNTGLLTQVGGRNIRYFTARDPFHGHELWRTDGTTDGTRLVKDIYPGPGDGMAKWDEYDDCNGSDSMAELNGVLYFCAGDPENAKALWRTDGTNAGTWMVKASGPTTLYSYLTQLTVAGNRLFYLTNYFGAPGQVLWVSDGTPAGTHVVLEKVPGTGGLSRTTLAALGNQVIFPVSDTPERGSFQLWRSDGTPQGTQPIFGPYTFTSSWGYLLEQVTSLGRLYFAMPDPADPASCARLWFTDGTSAGTKMVGMPGGVETVCYPGSLLQVDSTLYFTTGTSYTSSPPAIWALPAGASMASKMGDTLGYSPSYLGRLDSDTLLLLGSNQYSQENIWISIEIKNDWISTVVCYGCFPRMVYNQTPWLGRMYFTARPDYDQPARLWVTDGNQAGTAEIPNPTDGQGFSGADHFLSAGNVLYFTADDGIYGREPWMIRVEMNNQVFLPAVRH